MHASAAAPGAATAAATTAATSAASGAIIAGCYHKSVALGIAGGALFYVLGFLTYQAPNGSNLISN
jgi:hypothetical protein